jgi:hypothetical protein
MAEDRLRADAAQAGGSAGARAASAGRTGRTGWVVAAATAGVGVPLVVALVVLFHPRLYPVMDIAQTELLVRDVGTAHPPLVGLSSRMGAFGVRGSHPGPISFWALWPVYTLLGSSSWSLQAASVSLNLVAVAAATWIGGRRGGRAGALAVGVAMVVLARAYGADRLVDGWVANLPVLWWVVFLLAAWSVVCGDLVVLPVAVLAGSFAVQTHVSYLGLVPGIGAAALGLLLVRTLRPPRDPAAVRRIVQAVLLCGGLLAVLWLPALVDQIVHAPGNVSIIRESFMHPVEEQVGFGWDAVRVWLAHLDPWRLATGIESHAEIEAFTGPWLPGVVLLAAWAVAVRAAWRSRRRDLFGLHVVLGLALVLGLLSISQIYGPVYSYLVLWGWGTTALLVVATAWTAIAVAETTAVTTTATTPGWRASGPRVLAGVGLVVAGSFAYDAADADGLDSSVIDARELRLVLPDTNRALRAEEVPGTGPDGRYLLRWDESSVGAGALGVEMLLQLEHRGFDVGAPRHHLAAVGRGRVREVGEATATIDYVVGLEAIGRWRATPGATEVAYVDPREPGDIERYRRLRDEVVAGLRQAGLDDLAATVDRNVIAVVFDDRVPESVLPDVVELGQMRQPEAVFVTPT